MGSASSVKPDRADAIRSALLAWYDANKRDLPWRQRAGDPYAQWVAEIMLQQTRVETVIPYYLRFIERFPDVGTLARARHETVLKHWEGLGYYRRAMLLHDGAKQVRREGGTMPDSAEALRDVSGIGDYTAAAIASIAFGEPAAAVDGNVCRVIARLFCIDENILTSRGRARVKTVAEQLIPSDCPGAFNQAWMDLGSAACLPRNPKCLLCPLKNECRAFAEGRVDAYPVRESSTVVRDERVLVLVAVSDGRYLVRRRPRGGLWSGLWEFPNETAAASTDHQSVSSKRSKRETAGRLKRSASLPPPAGELPVAFAPTVAQILNTLGLCAPESSIAGLSSSRREKSDGTSGAKGNTSTTGRQVSPGGRGSSVVDPTDITFLGEVAHQLTHKRLTFVVGLLELQSSAVAPSAPYRWVTGSEFDRLSVSTAHRKIWKLVTGRQSKGITP